jgi:single-stranded-DNA-specific exonuclease
VIGIVAGRLKEKLGRPAIVIALDEERRRQGLGALDPGRRSRRGSTRRQGCWPAHAGGGHAMACGVTIAEDQLEAFADFLEERLGERIAAAMGERALLLDAVLAPGGVSPDLVTAMEAGGPYGMGWPAPRVAAGPLRVIKADVVGSGGHVRLIVAGEDGRSLKAVAFRHADTELGIALLSAPSHRKLWLAGRAKIDDWGARPAAELHIEDAAWAD